MSTVPYAQTRQPQSNDNSNIQTEDMQFHSETRASCGYSLLPGQAMAFRRSYVATQLEQIQKLAQQMPALSVPMLTQV